MSQSGLSTINLLRVRGFLANRRARLSATTHRYPPATLILFRRSCSESDCQPLRRISRVTVNLVRSSPCAIAPGLIPNRNCVSIGARSR